MINKHTPGSGSILVFLFLVLTLLATTGCTKHYATNITQANIPTIVETAIDTPVVIGRTLEDTLTALWKLSKIEIPGMIDKMTTFSSQDEKDEMDQRLKKYEDGLKGLTVNFHHDGTYESVYNGQSDVGNWKVNAQREINAVSKVTSGQSVFQIVSLTSRSLLAKYDPGDGILLLTFMRK